MCPCRVLYTILYIRSIGYRYMQMPGGIRAFLLRPRTPLCKYFERNRDRHLRNPSVRSAAIYKRRRLKRLERRRRHRRRTKAASLIKKSFKVCRISCFCFHSLIFSPVSFFFFLHICRSECNYLLYYNEFLIRSASISWIFIITVYCEASALGVAPDIDRSIL